MPKECLPVRVSLVPFLPLGTSVLLLRAAFWVYGHLEDRLAPGLEFAQHTYEAVLARTVAPGCRWLDLGCGHQLLPLWRRASEQALVARVGLMIGLDPECDALRKHASITTRVVGDGSFLPFADGAFDFVTANLVVEHLANPLDQFREVHRVLRPGGLFVFHTPNRRGHNTVIARMVPERLKTIGVRVLEGRPPEDRFRTYYRANTRPVIDRLAGDAGFRVTTFDFVPTSAMFAVVAPLAALELLWIRLTMKWLPELRSSLIVTLERQ